LYTANKAECIYRLKNGWKRMTDHPHQ